MRYLTILSIAVLNLVGCQSATREPDPARGPEILAPFKQNLQQALREGLAEGPVEAIAACQLKAPEIAASLSQGGVRVGRTSERLRNPDNAAPDWVVPALEAYSTDSDDRSPRNLSIGPGRSGYVEPIMVQPLCLACHGESLEPEVSSRIQALYPDDRATGYQIGDLRGVFWVEYPHDE